MKAALLIEASNVAGQLEIPGARRDVLNWESYLESNIGGAWNNINKKSKPTKEETRDMLQILGLFNKYLFVIFSGHGYHDAKNGRNIILLNDKEDVDVDELLPSSIIPCTLIVDACRSGESASDLSVRLANSVTLSESVNDVHPSAGMEQNFPAMNRSRSLGGLWKTAAAYSTVRYRSLFDESIQKYNGQTVMYSCSVGEDAGESSNNGGVYTHALLNSCQSWHDNNALRAPCVLSTYDAHHLAMAYMTRRREPQTPEYQSSGTAHLFPIAVKP